MYPSLDSIKPEPLLGVLLSGLFCLSSKNFLNKMRNIISSESIFGEASHWNDFISLRALAENPIELKKTIEEILILFVNEKSKIPRILSI